MTPGVVLGHDGQRIRVSGTGRLLAGPGPGCEAGPGRGFGQGDGRHGGPPSCACGPLIRQKEVGDSLFTPQVGLGPSPADPGAPPPPTRLPSRGIGCRVRPRHLRDWRREVRDLRPRRLRRRARSTSSGAAPARGRVMPTWPGWPPGRGGPRRGDPPAMAPGSDVGNMSILGYDPARYHTGRAPIEAAALGLKLRPDQVAYRCNLVEVGRTAPWSTSPAGTRRPRTRPRSSRPSTPSWPRAGRGRVPPWVQYRHIVVAPESWADASCTRPTTSRAGRPCCPGAGRGPS